MITPVNIDTLHAQIQDWLNDAFPSCSVSLYPRPGEKITTPAILIELDDIVTDDPDDVGTEQLSATINFNAYVVLDYKSGKKQAVKSLAAAVLAYVRGKRWSCPVGAANAIGAYPDIIAGREDDYEVMRVEFSHEAFLGVDVWTADQLLDEDGEPLDPPSEVYVSEAGEEFAEITNCNCS